MFLEVLASLGLVLSVIESVCLFEYHTIAKVLKLVYIVTGTGTYYNILIQIVKDRDGKLHKVTNIKLLQHRF